MEDRLGLRCLIQMGNEWKKGWGWDAGSSISTNCPITIFLYRRSRRDGPDFF